MHYTSRDVYEYMSTQTADPIVERKTCRISGTQFPIYQSDLDFYAKISPTFAGQKFQIPMPILCPEERLRRRLSWRNEKKLYKRTCGASGKSMISNYSPDKTYLVYGIEYWYSDARDAQTYGVSRENGTFSTSFLQVFENIPHISLMVKMNENCEYVNGCGNSKDCYLVFDTDFCERALYSSILKHSKNVVDSLHIYYCDTVYDCVNCTESFGLISCYECDQSSHLSHCILCSSCEFCINCANLVGKKYCINNIQYTKEEYEVLAPTVVKQLPEEYLQRATYKVRDAGGVGNNLYGTTDCHFSYNIGFSERLKYCDLVTDCQDCADISSFGGTTQRAVECASIGLDCSHIYFSAIITAGSHHVYNSYALLGCQYMFGCSFMKNASYCIYNVQYTPDERHSAVAKIVGQMQQEGTRGQFMGGLSSLFGYNETVAHEYFPLTQEQAQQRRYRWQEKSYDPVLPADADIVHRADYSDEAWVELSADPSVMQKIIVCAVSGKPFRIIKPEREFYQKHGLSIPSVHPDVRHAERVARLPKKLLHLRMCGSCDQEIISVYPHDHQGTVYCEDCYIKEVYA